MRSLVGLFTTLLVATAALYAFSPRTPTPLESTTLPVEEMLLTGIAHTSAGLVTAGELGKIMLSDDQGSTWRQTEIDTQRHALITRMVFTEEGRLGLAIGHEGWVLRTTDGGEHWQEVAFDDAFGEPLMDLARLPSGEWLAIGAFGLVLRSTDEGLTWEQKPAPEDTDWHLNAIAGSQDQRHWMIVGEAGTVIRSRDGGRSWEVLPEFYEGSLYGISHLHGGRWVAYGMRGNLFVTQDHGRHWERIQLDAPISLHAHLRLNADTLIIGGQGGVLLATTDRGNTFEMLQSGGSATLTDLYLDPAGEWWFTTSRGLLRRVNTTPLAQLSDAGASS